MDSSIGINVLRWLDVHVSCWEHVHDRSFIWVFRMDPEYDRNIVGSAYAAIRHIILLFLISLYLSLSLFSASCNTIIKH